jgi:hypothetical protein
MSILATKFREQQENIDLSTDKFFVSLLSTPPDKRIYTYHFNLNNIFC